jgi:hypothetical protein
MLMENWKPVKNYEQYYLVSNLGNVLSLYRNKLMKKNYDINNYPTVGLTKNGSSKTMRIHRLVATAFIPNIENKKTVNHIDCHKTNNNVENLEWATYKEQIHHAIKNGLRDNAYYKTSFRCEVYDKNKNQYYFFDSLSKGSCFIKRGKQYLCRKIKNNIYEDRQYKWRLL